MWKKENLYYCWWEERKKREKNKTFFYSFYSSCFILFGLGLGFVKGRGRDVDFLNLILRKEIFTHVYFTNLKRAVSGTVLLMFAMLK